MSALSSQVGGSHYKGLKIEPFTFALVNGYDAACFSVLKYVTRHAAKNGASCLAKASHICIIRVDESPLTFRVHAYNRIPMDRYIAENRVPGSEARILRFLHFWAQGWVQGQKAPGVSKEADRDAALWLSHSINKLSEDLYGKDPT